MEAVKALPRKLYLNFKAFVSRKREAAFIRHNKHTWRDFRRHAAQAEILLEAVRSASSIVSCRLYNDHHGFLEEIDGYYKQAGSISYKTNLEQFFKQKHLQILRRGNHG